MLVTLTLLLAATCLLPAIGKLGGHPRMRASDAHFGIAWERYQLIGFAELAAAGCIVAGLFWPPIGVLAGASLAILVLGAALTHLRAGDSARELVPALAVLALDALYLAVAVGVPKP
jgi:hypothetical protein